MRVVMLLKCLVIVLARVARGRHPHWSHRTGGHTGPTLSSKVAVCASVSLSGK